VVVDGATGVLVPLALAPDDPMSPADPDRYARDLADAINRLMADGDLRRRMGEAGRRRAVEHFSWGAIADQTVALYRSLVS